MTPPFFFHPFGGKEVVRPKILGSENAFCWAKRHNHHLKLMLESGPRPGCKDGPARCLRGQEDRCLTKKKRGDKAGGAHRGDTDLRHACRVRHIMLHHPHVHSWGQASPSLGDVDTEKGHCKISENSQG